MVKQELQSEGHTKKNKTVVNDQRFKKLGYDPKFKPIPQDMKKVKVDKRFAGMMTKKKFKVVSEVDKYGRKVEDEQQNKQLKEYYQMEEEEQPEEQHSLGSEQQQNLHDWMQNYNQESDTDSQLQIEGLLDQQKELWSDNEEVVRNQNVKVTKRLALCNYDWINIKTPDLMILFNSFKPASGIIEKIQLYQSDFGKQRMQQQNVKGPADIWKHQQQQTIQNKRKKILKKLFINDRKKVEQNDIDMTKLREYEKQRLRYFYSVIYCDTKQTAESIYNLCDGKQFQNSNSIDLRYIPDDLVFPRPPQDVCDKLPQKAGDIKNKVLRSVGHSHVTLSWQDPEVGTLTNLKKMNWAKMKSSQYKDIDWSLYIDDHLSSDEQNKQQQNNDQQQDSFQEQVDDFDNGYKRNNKKDRACNDDQQMQIIFTGGFDLAKKVKQKKEQQFQKRQQKRDVKKQKQQKKKISKNKKRMQQEQQYQQEQQVAPEQKQRRKNYLQLMVNKKKQQKQFQPNVLDPRFGDVYKNPNMQIDPNNSLFNPSKSGQVFKEVVRRAKNRSQ